MGTSLFKIAEQVRSVSGKNLDIQDILASVVDCFSAVAKKEYYENRQDGVSEIDGAFVYTFGLKEPIEPMLDLILDKYYIVKPSSYLRLPYEQGIVHIGYLKGAGFVRLTSGSASMFDRLKSSVMGGNQTYYTEGTRIYFPKMTNTTNGKILLKMAVAYDNIDVDEELDIPRSIIATIVDMVVAKYAPQKPDIEQNIE